MVLELKEKLGGSTEILAVAGTPEQIAQVGESYTGKYLRASMQA